MFMQDLTKKIVISYQVFKTYQDLAKKLGGFFDMTQRIFLTKIL
jgi:hypothetical protein